MNTTLANHPRTARAAITDGKGGFTLDAIEVRPPLADEVRVIIAAAGICHTDHASLSWEGPLVAGHEGAGWVEAAGPLVTDLAPGTPVLLNWAIPCGQCVRCDAGQPNICERTHGISPHTLGSSRAGAGHTLWRGRPIERAFNLGTFSGMTLVRRQALTPLRPEIPLTHASILGCGVMTGVGSVLNCAQPKPGDTIAVLGCGGVGLSVIQGARLAGAGRIIALDIRSESLARAARFGATDTILVDPTDGDHVGMIEAVKALTDGRGADAAFEATGVAALAFVPLRLVRNGGTAVQVSGAHGSVEVHMPHFWWDKRYITPLYGGCDPQRDFPRLMAWAISGEINLPAMISQTYALDDLGAALDDMLAGRIIKGVVVFPGGPDHVSNF